MRPCAFYCSTQNIIHHTLAIKSGTQLKTTNPTLLPSNQALNFKPQTTNSTLLPPNQAFTPNHNPNPPQTNNHLQRHHYHNVYHQELYRPHFRNPAFPPAGSQRPHRRPRRITGRLRSALRKSARPHRWRIPPLPQQSHRRCGEDAEEEE